MCSYTLSLYHYLCTHPVVQGIHIHTAFYLTPESEMHLKVMGMGGMDTTVAKRVIFSFILYFKEPLEMYHLIFEGVLKNNDKTYKHNKK